MACRDRDFFTRPAEDVAGGGAVTRPEVRNQEDLVFAQPGALPPAAQATVDDVDHWWAKPRDRSEVVEPLFDTPYGTRK